MENNSEIVLEQKADYSKASGYVKLTKMRLSLLVVFSAIISYFTIATETDWIKVAALAVGGFLVTASANTFNQVIERDLDKLMKRTQNRPIPTNTLSPAEALIFAAICGIAGVAVLYLFTNPLSGLLSLLSIALYAFAYTPLKRITPFSVFVGAIPGALPTLIGAIADDKGFGTIALFPLLLYTIQFFWQFPHFWAIAWVSHDDYQRAGFFMLPSLGGRDQSSRFQILVYTLFLLPISILPYLFGFTGIISGSVVLVCGILFYLQAYKLYRDGAIESAKKLMFGSFFYLPLVQLALMIGK